MLLTTSACVYWGSIALPNAYKTDGRSGALLMALVVFSILAMVALIGFIVVELSDELAADKKRRDGETDTSTEKEKEKKVS